MKKLSYCDKCGKDVGFATSQRKIKGKFKGVSFVCTETLCQCAECGNYVEYPKITEANLRAFYDGYKDAVGLLTGDAIVAIRKKYGLSAESFSLMLGFGAKTITRYENGAIQTKEADNLIRLADREDVAAELANRAGIVLETDYTPIVIGLSPSTIFIMEEFHRQVKEEYVKPFNYGDSFADLTAERMKHGRKRSSPRA